MTRTQTERKISSLLKNVNTLQGLKVCLSKCDQQIHNLSIMRKNLTKKHAKEKNSIRREMKFWYLFRNRIYLTSEMWVNDALDEQLYQIIPEHERTSITKYRYLARFRLNAVELNRVIGYDKLVKYGWYSSTNPTGVVKDHRLSIKFGFENKIDPKILSHPCNCEFLTFKENGLKSDNCSIGLILLQESIENWKIDASTKRS